jgi:hypothetical protein
MPRASKATWDSVRRVMQRLPGAVEGTSYGTAAFHVRRKFLVRLREDGETLAVRCDFDERDARMAADPKAFFITDHYKNYPAVCVRLAAVKAADLKSVLESAWRREAGSRLVEELERKASR